MNKILEDEKLVEKILNEILEDTKQEKIKWEVENKENQILHLYNFGTVDHPFIADWEGKKLTFYPLINDRASPGYPNLKISDKEGSTQLGGNFSTFLVFKWPRWFKLIYELSYTVRNQYKLKYIEEREKRNREERKRMFKNLQ